VSGIAGICNLDGQSADPAILQRMIDRVAHRGPDACGKWISGSVALAHRMLRTTPESLNEHQPLNDDTNSLCLTFDGRVDNRDELRIELEAEGWSAAGRSDADLVLRAYQCWGKDCPVRIIGDFAFAIWDGRTRELFCARDFIGIKPFYYYCDAHRFIFGSELQQILEHPEVRRKPNEGMVAEYLAAMPGNLRETLYENIFQLPRAHRLTLRQGKLHTDRYYSVGDVEEIRYRKDEDYAQHFLGIFKESVKCRLRSNGMVAADLSGGLDSSSVVSVAQSLCQDVGAQPVDFETFSVHFPGARYDETYYVRDVVKRWDLRANFVNEECMTSYSFIAKIHRFKDFPSVPNSSMFDRKMAAVQAKPCRVVLNGLGSDDLLSGSFQYTADLIRRLRVFKAIQQSRLDSGFLAHLGASHSASSLFLRNGLWPLLPQVAKQIARAAMGKNPSGMPMWIDPDFARTSGLAERLGQSGIASDTCRSLAGSDIREGLNFPFYWLIDRDFSQFSVEYRSPFLDRRLIRYSLALPHDQLRRGMQAKFVLRQAMKGMLPETVRTRLTKSRFGSHSYWDAIQGIGGSRFLDSLAIGSQRWVNTAEVRKMYAATESQRTLDNPYSTRFLFPLWMICAIELWYRTVFVDGIDSSMQN
jgi:asparagine synthase (glutamine-hydrolysing)